jgi:hypothetical protein
MHMLGEHHPGVDGKRMEPVYTPDASPQHIDLPHQQIVAAPLQKIHREKPARSRNEGSTIVRHPCLSSFA